MKSRQKILIFLVVSICGYISTELLLQYNWRATSQLSRIGELQSSTNSSDAPAFKPQLRVASPGKTLGISVQGFHVLLSDLEETNVLKRAVFQLCCSGNHAECGAALKKVQNIEPNSFTFFHDTDCKNLVDPIQVDNVGYATDSNPDFLSDWLVSWNFEHKFQGPFESMYPIVYVRSINVLTGQEQARSAHPDLRYLHSSVADMFEVIEESSSFYGGPEALGAVSESLGATDPHDQSRLINKEVLVWTGSSHISSYGTFSMPPIAHIATVQLPDNESSNFVPLPSDLYQVDHFGFIYIPSNSSRNPIPDITNVWLGRTDSNPISNLDILSMKSYSRKTFLKNAIKNLAKLDNILSEFSDLEFPESTAAVVDSAINHIELSMNSPSLDESLRYARLAVIESLEALNDHAVTDSPYFSIEYMFALYAPLALPISVPVLSALIRYIRERRAVKKI